MTTSLKIDFVSDIACPWCAIGLKSLDQALERVAGDISAKLHFQPSPIDTSRRIAIIQKTPANPPATSQPS